MKQIISIGLILIMSAQSFYKLGVITYFQLNRDYIAEVLCINKEEPVPTCKGQCFLKKKLDVDKTADTTPTPAPAGKEKVDIPLFLVSDYSCSFGIVPQTTSPNTGLSLQFPEVDRDAPFHPPTVQVITT